MSSRWYQELFGQRVRAPGHEDFDHCVDRVLDGLSDGWVAEPAMNPDTGTREFTVRDPDGCYVSVSSLS